MGKAVELRKVNKTYPGAVPAPVLFDINLAFEQGTFNALIGQSGSGKSTLMNIMGTLDSATSGDVLIDGSSTGGMKKAELAALRTRTIGFVFQFHYLLPEFTAIENVLMPHLIAHGKAGPEALKRAEELMELVGLTDVKNNLSTKVSGGQQQRTAIARALMNAPRLILADEPTGNLDSETTVKIYRLFRDINKSTGTTFIIVTHDRRIAEEADRIVEIKDGRIFMDIKK
jgi:lipoprotein-releasing system ATP-binding protein